MPDLLLLCTAGEEGERGIERERERDIKLWMDASEEEDEVGGGSQ